MIRELKDKAGIYIIINKINLNKYVGSAITNNLYQRFNRHMLNFHGSKFLKKSVLKHGLNNFIFGILEYYPEALTSKDQNKLFELETMYISLLLPEYNILKEAGTSTGYKHTDEVMEKMKNIYTLERRKILSDYQKNRI
jgi:group I intron endonuclease